MTDLGFFGANAINNLGIIAGAIYNFVDNTFHAISYSEGNITDLGTLGSVYINSGASDINMSGQVVGSSYSSGYSASHAFFYSSGIMADLGTLGGPRSWAYGLNDKGQVVGDAEISAYETHAYIYDSGVMKDLNDLIDPDSGWLIRYAVDINNNGEIAANGYHPDFGGGALILRPRSVTPIPTLSEWAQILLALSLMGMAGWYWHRRAS